MIYRLKKAIAINNLEKDDILLIIGSRQVGKTTLHAGCSLENAVFSEMIKSNISEIRFWRTQTKHEVDFIIDNLIAFEIKMGSA